MSDVTLNADRAENLRAATEIVRELGRVSADLDPVLGEAISRLSVMTLGAIASAARAEQRVQDLEDVLTKASSLSGVGRRRAKE